MHNFANEKKKDRAKRKLMEGFIRTGFTCVMATMAFPTETIAQDKIKASVGADLVSGYVWRGLHLAGISVQPSATIEYKGFSLNAWGSVGFTSDDTKDIDLELGYTNGGLNISLTDYWSDEGIGYFHYGARNTEHVFEAHAGYDFGPVAVNWYTNIAGCDGITPSGKRAYSSYINLSAPFQLGGLEWSAEIGATPWATTYYNYKNDDDPGAQGFEICDISLKASKEIKITQSFSLPLFAQITWNPSTEGAYFVVGLSF